MGLTLVVLMAGLENPSRIPREARAAALVQGRPQRRASAFADSAPELLVPASEERHAAGAALIWAGAWLLGAVMIAACLGVLFAISEGIRSLVG
jgi:hypothetical protein